MTKEEVDEIMKIPGNVRGEAILTDFKYVRYRKGGQGLKMLEEKLKELGWPIKLEDIRSMEWYPIRMDILKILIIKEIFNWTDKDIFEMGSFSAKGSFLMEMLMKYFISPQKSFGESPKYWKKNFDFGELEAHEFNKKKKYIVFRLRNFKTHPVICANHAGYFLQMAKYVLKSKNITVEETKCMFKGDPYHEYIIRWE
ncbi:MAG: hypothetical protein A2998_01270 [Candidatus Staskawiczbacteria bacterium RIFCSPLOWO2_01_FULL_37_25b]|uniref:4-vinyl reductase 4VR domain-containing protein n=2 Tax=Candidatus Staskawicziibacteriota TaxID=1817916 RepID=A0A1G2HN87_9BACT|nr:MAG: hypothetical protein A2812_02185 [Candidatus Staskawiczbacteria bacterium RIFCSPHIGHO2_01_FULL_36_16]OGZ73408.1 MAG: hypothetical protein A2998_01270 [Candidatus Staskawiczbacteria bacterium RIFCSPLOWO2_01_FULL_37_25b]